MKGSELSLIPGKIFFYIYCTFHSDNKEGKRYTPSGLCLKYNSAFRMTAEKIASKAVNIFPNNIDKYSDHSADISKKSMTNFSLNTSHSCIFMVPGLTCLHGLIGAMLVVSQQWGTPPSLHRSVSPTHPPHQCHNQYRMSDNMSLTH